MPRKTQSDIEWENRTLCSDESCIGVIGPDGRCKECGKPYDETQKETDAPTPFVDDVQEDAPGQDVEDLFREESEAAPEEELNIDEEWESRTLCCDESCIGVIGPDKRCKECGKPYEIK